MKWHFDHPILHIELNCEPCNEIGMSMLSFFEDFLQQAPLENAKALIISSSNAKGFSAGADLRSLYEGLTYEPKKSHKEKIENFRLCVLSEKDK